jgi:hypothetical protein
VGTEDEREVEEPMRGDSNDTLFAWSAVVCMGIWSLLVMVSAVLNWWYLFFFLLGMPTSLGLLFLSLYKEWWPTDLRVRDFFKVL